MIVKAFKERSVSARVKMDLSKTALKNRVFKSKAFIRY